MHQRTHGRSKQAVRQGQCSNSRDKAHINRCIIQLFLFRIHKVFCKARQTLSSSLSLTERVRIHKRRLPWQHLLWFLFLSISLLPKHHFRHPCKEHLCLSFSASVPLFEAADTASLQHFAGITSRVLLPGKFLAFLQVFGFLCWLFYYFYFYLFYFFNFKVVKSCYGKTIVPFPHLVLSQVDPSSRYWWVRKTVTPEVQYESHRI